MADYRVRWSEAARADLTEIIDYIAADSPLNALNVLDRLEEAAATLTRHPERGRHIPELRELDLFLYREKIVRPWRLLYRIEGKDVFVLAVLDGRRDLAGLLLERLTR